MDLLIISACSLVSSSFFLQAHKICAQDGGIILSFLTVVRPCSLNIELWISGPVSRFFENSLNRDHYIPYDGDKRTPTKPKKTNSAPAALKLVVNAREARRNWMLQPGRAVVCPNQILMDGRHHRIKSSGCVSRKLRRQRVVSADLDRVGGQHGRTALQHYCAMTLDWMLEYGATTLYCAWKMH